MLVIALIPIMRDKNRRISPYSLPKAAVLILALSLAPQKPGVWLWAATALKLALLCAALLRDRKTDGHIPAESALYITASLACIGYAIYKAFKVITLPAP